MILRDTKFKKFRNLLIVILENIINEKYEPFEIIYRIYYKITRVNYNFRARRESSKDETIIIHANSRRYFVQTLKKLQQEELIQNIPEEWILKDALTTLPPYL
ncbi:hypothetical protein AHAS_Ahas05G0147800 [Arachis hypogaea]